MEITKWILTEMGYGYDYMDWSEVVKTRFKYKSCDDGPQNGLYQPVSYT
jgi:hypothetical protein